MNRIRTKETDCVSMLIVITIGVALSSCGTKHAQEAGSAIHYPLPFPDSTVLPFLPGIVSTDSFDFNAAFSPDGKSFYFTRRINDKSKIMMTAYANEKWSSPVVVSLLESDYAEADPAFGPDGNLYFISNRPQDAQDTVSDYDIWFVSPTEDGRWSTPQPLNVVNSDSSEYYISFLQNGNLYFASSRQGGYGEEDIYVSVFANGKYSTPKNLGEAINSSKSEYDPCISQDEKLIIFTSSNREDSFGKADLYASSLNASKQWNTSINLGEKINTPTRDFCPYFTSDFRFFFYSSEGDVKWISREVLLLTLDSARKFRENNQH